MDSLRVQFLITQLWEFALFYVWKHMDKKINQWTENEAAV